MKTLRFLTLDNPMLIEARRFMLRFSGFDRGSVNNAVLVLVMLTYVMLMLLVISIPAFEPLAILYFQTGIYCFLLPSMLQGSIAGERERGTWETLLATPVTKGQIVVGKFWSAVVAVLAVAVALAFPVIYTNSQSYSSGAGNAMSLGHLILGECLSVSFAICLAGWCLLVSARSKRSFSAQGMIYGSLLTLLILWPALVATLGAAGDNGLFGFLNGLHPFIVSSTLLGSNPADLGADEVRQFTPNGWISVTLYLLLTAVFLFWAEKTLRFVESDVQFMPRGHRASDN